MGQGDRFKKIDGLKREKNGGDFVLESRHLVGLFMLLVVIFGVVLRLDMRVRCNSSSWGSVRSKARSNLLSQRSNRSSSGESGSVAGVSRPPFAWVRSIRAFFGDNLDLALAAGAMIVECILFERLHKETPSSRAPTRLRMCPFLYKLKRALFHKR